MLARWLTGLVLCSLLACGSNPPAPVEDRSGRTTYGTPTATSSTASSNSYLVQRGDTLYSIAFRYGLDFRKVAAANRIPAPYTIYPGQRLALREAPVPASAPSTPGKPASASSSSRTRTAPPAPVATEPAPKNTTVTKSSSSAAKKSSPYTGAAVGAWRWPAEGRVLRRYSSTVHKGIDIGGKRGDPVKAVAAGKVVYSGTGIVGFGELLIVKHNEVYLSAYGHNDRLLVAEGDTVKAGQIIAEKGSSGTDIVKLHFEIRKEGKPVDPLRLLPRR